MVWHAALVVAALSCSCRLPAQLVSQPDAVTACAAKPAPGREPCSAPEQKDLGKPLRKIGWLCAPEESYCHNESSIAVGSGGAAVDGFYTLRHDSNAREVRVSWNCPDPQRTVVVRLLIPRYPPWWWKGPCGKGSTGDAFKLSVFRYWQSGLLLPLVQLLPNSDCEMPVYLVAQVTVPTSYFVASDHLCKRSGPCLLLSSTFGSPYGWMIKAGAAEKTGVGKIESVAVAVSALEKCEYLPLSVDFAEKEAGRDLPRTVIGELWF